MKYAYQEEPIPQDKRKALNEKVLYLIDSGRCGECSISPEDIYNAYTGDGGLWSGTGGLRELPCIQRGKERD